MVPTMIVLGLVFGRWWKAAIPLGAAYWTWILVSAGTLGSTDVGTLATVALVGGANTAAGAAVNRGFAWLIRRLPREGRWPEA